MLCGACQLSQTISMHRPVHQWAFDRLSSDHRPSSLRLSAATLALSIPMGDEMDDIVIRLQRFPHVVALRQRAAVDNTDPLRNAPEMDRVYEVLVDDGRWFEAILLQRRVLELTENLLGTEHGETPLSKTKTACALYSHTKSAEAETLSQQAYDTQETARAGAWSHNLQYGPACIDDGRLLDLALEPPMQGGTCSPSCHHALSPRPSADIHTLAGATPLPRRLDLDRGRDTLLARA